MQKEQKRMIYIGIGVITALVIFIGLGFHQKPNYIRNYELEEFGRAYPFSEPVSVQDGLAVYSTGVGQVVLVFPYPHAHNSKPMIQSELAEIFNLQGRKVITFDVPGAYRSTREPIGDMDEMLRSAEETLDRLGIDRPVDVVGHSMGSLAALAFAIERPERVRRLILVGSMSGFPAAIKNGLPGSAFQMTDLDYWKLVFWGMKVNSGRGSLALHKKLANLMGKAAYHDPSLFVPLEIEADDFKKGIPIRMIWGQNVYKKLSYADRLGEVKSPTLVLVGRYDTYTPLECSDELAAGIPDVEMRVFEQSGHAPFIEEADLFAETTSSFLSSE